MKTQSLVWTAFLLRWGIALIVTGGVLAVLMLRLGPFLSSGVITFLSRIGTSPRYSINTVDVNYGSLWRITRKNAVYLAPTYSADGRRIIFAAQLPSIRNLQAYIMNDNGSDIQQLTRSDQTITFPAWSPDGQQVAFVRDSTWIEVMNLDGTHQRRVGTGRKFSWSPDGQQIVFETLKVNLRIFVVNVNEGVAYALTDEVTNNVNPAWSPDGKSIVFSSDRDGSQQLYLMDADGGNQRRLTPGSGGNYQPVWSLDSRQIAFVSNRDKDKEIYVMNADGSNQRRFTWRHGDDILPVWRPA